MSHSGAANRTKARTDTEAKKRFLRYLRLSLSVVTDDAIWIIVPRGDSHAAITNPAVLKLPVGIDSEFLYLRSSIQFEYKADDRYPKERKVSTLSYVHTIGCEDSLKPQLYSWEWVAAEPKYPHIHIHRSNPKYEGLGKLHIPTGRVFYEDIIRFLVEEHGVKTARPDWENILGESITEVSEHATWGKGPKKLLHPQATQNRKNKPN